MRIFLSTLLLFLSACAISPDIVESNEQSDGDGVFTPDAVLVDVQYDRKNDRLFFDSRKGDGSFYASIEILGVHSNDFKFFEITFAGAADQDPLEMSFAVFKKTRTHSVVIMTDTGTSAEVHRSHFLSGKTDYSADGLVPAHVMFEISEIIKQDQINRSWDIIDSGTNW